MARLVLAVIFVAIVVGAAALLALGIRASATGTDAGKGLDMADTGVLAKVAYVLLLLLIVYVTLTASGS